MENRKVIKIGGSNLKEIKDIRKMRDVVCQYPKAPVVVVSAFYGVTDRLISCLNEMIEAPEKIDGLIGYLNELKHLYAIDLIKDEDIRDKVFGQVKENLSKLKEYLCKRKNNGFVNAQDKDYVLSFGERLSSIIIWGAIKSSNEKCRLAFPEHMGLITDNVFGNASVDLEKSKNNLKAYFDPDYIYVVPGFYGVSLDGKVNLLGRGGTDYSAASLAFCIEASTLDIWKDVDGFMTGDPKHIREPQQVCHLSYPEAAELAYFGAGILHPRTVEPLSITNIPIRLFNSCKDDAFSEPQTIIDQHLSFFPDVVKSLTFENKIAILNVKGPGVGFIPGILSAITKALSENSINISSVITSQISINLLIGIDDIDKAKELVKNLEIHAVTDVSVRKGISLVAVVGNGMTQRAGIAARIFAAIASENINIILSSLGASDVVTYFIIDKNDTGRAIKKLHDELFKEPVRKPEFVSTMQMAI
jgi:bifunctional aspartokinase / homoserine dehydrogenase 1